MSRLLEPCLIAVLGLLGGGLKAIVELRRRLELTGASVVRRRFGAQVLRERVCHWLEPVHERGRRDKVAAGSLERHRSVGEDVSVVLPPCMQNIPDVVRLVVVSVGVVPVACWSASIYCFLAVNGGLPAGRACRLAWFGKLLRSSDRGIAHHSRRTTWPRAWLGGPNYLRNRLEVVLGLGGLSVEPGAPTSLERRSSGRTRLGCRGVRWRT